MRSIGPAPGFSLVELMVVLVLTAIVTIVIYRSYLAMQVGVEVQDQESDLHQSLRVGMDRLTRSLRTAGYKLFEAGAAAATPGFVAADTASVRFTCDHNGDGDLLDSDANGDLSADEDLTFQLDGNNNLTRTDNNAGTTDTIIPNVSALNLVYLDRNGAVMPTPVSAATLDEIRTIEVTLVARARNEDFSYVNNDQYVNLQNTIVAAGAGDNFRRRRLASRVKIRNLGL